MLFLDGVYIGSADNSRLRFRWVKAPTSDELTHLTHTIAHRVARYLERQGLLERDAGVATKVNERAKLERLCRYITRPSVSTKRLSLTRNGQVRYELKTPWRNGTR